MVSTQQIIDLNNLRKIGLEYYQTGKASAIESAIAQNRVAGKPPENGVFPFLISAIDEIDICLSRKFDDSEQETPEYFGAAINSWHLLCCISACVLYLDEEMKIAQHWKMIPWESLKLKIRHFEKKTKEYPTILYEIYKELCLIHANQEFDQLKELFELIQLKIPQNRNAINRNASNIEQKTNNVLLGRLREYQNQANQNVVEQINQAINILNIEERVEAIKEHTACKRLLEDATNVSNHGDAIRQKLIELQKRPVNEHQDIINEAIEKANIISQCARNIKQTMQEVPENIARINDGVVLKKFNEALEQLDDIVTKTRALKEATESIKEPDWENEAGRTQLLYGLMMIGEVLYKKDNAKLTFHKQFDNVKVKTVIALRDYLCHPEDEFGIKIIRTFLLDHNEEYKFFYPNPHSNFIIDLKELVCYFNSSLVARKINDIIEGRSYYSSIITFFSTGPWLESAPLLGSSFVAIRYPSTINRVVCSIVITASAAALFSKLQRQSKTSTFENPPSIVSRFQNVQDIEVEVCKMTISFIDDYLFHAEKVIKGYKSLIDPRSINDSVETEWTVEGQEPRLITIKTPGFSLQRHKEHNILKFHQITAGRLHIALLDTGESTLFSDKCQALKNSLPVQEQAEFTKWQLTIRDSTNFLAHYGQRKFGVERMEVNNGETYLRTNWNSEMAFYESSKAIENITPRIEQIKNDLQLLVP